MAGLVTGDYCKVAVGSLAERKVLAATHITKEWDGASAGTLHVSIYEFRENGIGKVWEAVLHGLMPEASRLATPYFADINNDGSQEMLLVVPDRGMLVLVTDSVRTPRPSANLLPEAAPVRAGEGGERF
jgi:hypothetical protein